MDPIEFHRQLDIALQSGEMEDVGMPEAAPDALPHAAADTEPFPAILATTR